MYVISGYRGVQFNRLLIRAIMYGANPYPHRTVAKPVKLGTRASWIVAPAECG